MIEKERFTVLLVEDDESDAFLIQHAFAEAGLSARLLHVKNGEDALAFLRRIPPWHEAPRPDLILSDLNMPRMDGLTLLEQIKSDTDLRDIPTVILSTSSAETDIMLSYQHYAAGYLVKPMDLDTLAAQLSQLVEYWRNLVSRPSYALA